METEAVSVETRLRETLSRLDAENVTNMNDLRQNFLCFVSEFVDRFGSVCDFRLGGKMYRRGGKIRRNPAALRRFAAAAPQQTGS